MEDARSFEYDYEYQEEGEPDVTSDVEENMTNHSPSAELTDDAVKSKKTFNGLHAQLSNEADKIHQWKSCLAIELRKKDQVIEEGKATREALRKALLDLQLENESLSGKLQGAEASVESARTWISGTKQMYQVFKRKVGKLEEKVHRCEEHKDTLEKEEKGHKDLLEDLTGKFHNLSVSSEEKVRKLQKKREDLEAKMGNKLEKAEKMINSYVEKLTARESDLKHIRIDMRRKEEQIEALQLNIRDLDLKVNGLERSVSSKEHALEKVQQILQKTEVAKEETSEKLDEVQEQLDAALSSNSKLLSDLDNTKRQLEEQIAVVTKEKDELLCQLQEERARVQEAHEKIAEEKSEKEQLKDTKDSLTLKKIELSHQVDILQKEKRDLSLELEQCEQQYRNAYKIAETKDEELQKISNQLEEYLKDAEDKDEIISSLKLSAENSERELRNMESENAALKEQESLILTELDESKKALETTQSSLLEAESAYEEMKKSAKNIEEKAALEKAAFEERIKDLTQMIEVKNEELLNARTDVVETEQTKKQIRELECQVSSLKEEKDDMMKSLESMRDEFQTKVKLLEECNLKYTSEIKALEGKLLAEKARADEAIMSHECAQERFDAMMKTVAESKNELEKTMSENISLIQKNVQMSKEEILQKENEIQKLRQELDAVSQHQQMNEQADERNKEQEAKLRHARREICDLKFQVDRLKEESKGYQSQLALYKDMHQITTPKPICKTPLRMTQSFGVGPAARKRRVTPEDPAHDSTPREEEHRILDGYMNSVIKSGLGGANPCTPRAPPKPIPATPSAQSAAKLWTPRQTYGIQKSAQARNSPVKKTPKVKFFNASPKRRSQLPKTPKARFFQSPLTMKRLQNKEKCHDMSWLQTDDVFGFDDSN